MADDAGAIDPQERRTAFFAVLESPTDILERSFGQSPFGIKPTNDFGRYGLEEEVSHSLAHFEDHVADEALADDDIHSAGIEITAFDVPDVTLFEPTL